MFSGTRIAAGATALLALAISRPAPAQDASAHFSLSWARLPGATPCISGNALARNVEARLRRPVFVAPGAADISVEGYVEATGTTFHAVISIADSKGSLIGTRELSSADASCRDLDAQLALTIALMIDPNAAGAPAPSPNAASASPLTPAVPRNEPPSRETEQVAAAGPVPETWRSTVQAGGALGLGLLPAVAPGAMLRAGLVPPRMVRVVLEAAFWSEEDATPADSANAVGFSLAYGGLGACAFDLGGPAVVVRLCAALTAGVISTRGLDDGAILVRHRFTAAALLRGEVVANMGAHFFVAAGAAASTPFIRDTFEYQHDGQSDRLFRPSAVAGVFDLSLGFQSP